MKNKYTLAQLEKIELITDIEKKELIFFKMLDLTTKLGKLEPIYTLDALQAYISDKPYFIGHNCLWVKGKQRRFIGELAIAEGPSIIKFIDSTLAINDLRPMLVAPLFSTEPDIVIHINDDGAFWAVRRTALN